MSEPVFKVGDKVKWESQAGGKIRGKEGKIVERVAPGALITKILELGSGITEIF